MEIRKIGDQTIFLKGKKENILINPSKELLSTNKYQSRVIVFTDESFDELGLDNEKVIIRGPGEYEVGGVEVLGINGGGGEPVYVVNMDGITVCVVGDLKEALTDKKVDRVNAGDVLIASIKKNDKVDGKLLLEWAKKWGVNYLLPMGYDNEKENLTKLLDITDQESLEPIESFKIEKDNLPDGMEVVLLKNI